MTFALPTRKAQTAEPYLIDFGGILQSALGGPDQPLNRLGNRFGVTYQLPPMKGDEARIWIARLMRGLKEKASYYFPQPGVTVTTATGTVASAAIANATILSLSAGTYREGQFFSIVQSAKRYVHQVTADGTGLISIQPPLRAPISVGAVATFNNPQIEGYVKGDRRSWNIDQAKIYGLSFSIEEAE